MNDVDIDGACERQLALPEGSQYDLRATFVPLYAGGGEATMRLSREQLVRATRTREGPATLVVTAHDEGRLRAQVFGPGGAWLLQRLEAVLGLDVTPPACPLDAPSSLRRLHARARGVRMPRTHNVAELLMLIVLQQKVRGREASRSYRHLVQQHSEPAPGPFEGLRLPLDPRVLRRLPLSALYEAAIDAQRAATLREVAFVAGHLQRCAELDVDAAEELLSQVKGLGPWSVGEALLRGLGAADAVPTGDYHLPSAVAYNLVGEERADDARMLALLAPYRGLRGWVIRWILAGGRQPPRRGPRRALRPGPRRQGSSGPGALR